MTRARVQRSRTASAPRGRSTFTAIALASLLVIGSSGSGTPALAAGRGASTSPNAASASAPVAPSVATPVAATAPAAALPAAAAAVFEGRLFTWHGDKLPAPTDSGVALEIGDRQVEVEMSHDEGHRYAGKQVRIRGTLANGVIVPAAGTSPEVIAATGTAGAEGTTAAAEATITSTTSATVAATATVRKVAVILINFTDVSTQPFSAATAEDVVLDADGTNARSVRAYYEENSDGAVTLEGAVLGWYRIDASSGGCAYRTWATLARAAAAADATAAGIDLTSGSTLKVYAFPNASTCGWAGLGELPGDESWINNSMNLRVVAHELGHNLGVHHAATRACTTATGARTPITSRIADDCTAYSEYGDPFSVMGSGTNNHHAWHRAQLGYAIATQTVSITTGTDITVSIASVEPEPAPGTVRLVRVVRGTSGTFLDLDLRRASGAFDTWTSTNPIVTGVGARLGYANTNRSQSVLLDATPATASHSDAPIPAGGSLWDPVAGARVTVLSVTDGTALVRIQADPDGAVPTSPGTPTASASSTPRVVLSWGAATDDRLLAGYEIRRNGVRIGVAKALSFTDCATATGCALVAGNTYTYDIYAYDAAGKLSPAASIVVTVPPSDTVAPTAPGTPTVTSVGPTATTITWTAATDEGSGVGGYEVFRIDGTARTLVATTATTSATISGLAPETTYAFTVRAFDVQANRGPDSGSVLVQTLAPPQAPVIVSVTSVASGVTVVYQGSDTVSTYELGRQTYDSRKRTWSAVTVVATMPACTSATIVCQVVHKPPKAGTYQFSVRAKSGTYVTGWGSGGSVVYSTK